MHDVMMMADKRSVILKYKACDGGLALYLLSRKMLVVGATVSRHVSRGMKGSRSTSLSASAEGSDLPVKLTVSEYCSIATDACMRSCS